MSSAKLPRVALMDRAVKNRRGPTDEVKPSSGVYFMNDADSLCVDISMAPIESPVPIPEVTIEQLAAENTRLREELERAVEKRKRVSAAVHNLELRRKVLQNYLARRGITLTKSPEKTVIELLETHPIAADIEKRIVERHHEVIGTQLEAASETIGQLRKKLDSLRDRAVRHAWDLGWMLPVGDCLDEVHAGAAIDWMSDQLQNAQIQNAQKDPDEVQADIVIRLSELEETVDGLANQNERQSEGSS